MDLRVVFAGLDQTDWSRLHHAYGSAEDIPALLRDLASPVEKTAAEAEQELWSSIVHQGTVYSATAPAVPFLARLADRLLAAARAGSYARDASAVLKACVALGPTAFTHAQLDLLRDLADGDRRIVGAGPQNRIILADEHFRVEARNALRTLTVSSTGRQV
ncbi:hypothetical protein ACWDE0_02425 [Streptomyces sp. 900105755]|uniref:hypothetical protein n=1 Tax=unclassified Streptomyces TaxID=2593676 RepID=UPI00089A4ADE|nr:hypothetical protein [Streptomyces sp. Ag109_O5-10]SEE86551.1 hypothetical protein SAMN05216533_4049 [Streptomyces sp. Ag109_O5-10]